MASKTFTKKGAGSSGKQWVLNLICDYTQDVDKNQTTITAVLKVTVPSGVGSPYNKTGSSYYKIFGNKTSSAFSLSSGQTATIGTGKKTVPHDNEGKATINVSFEWYTGIGSQWTPLEFKFSTNWELPQIARATTISTNTASLKLTRGQSFTVTLNKKNSAYTHDLYLKNANNTDNQIQLASKTKDNKITYTINDSNIKDIYNLLGTSNKTKKVNIECTTKKDNKKIGSTTTSITLNADPNECGYDFSSISVTGSGTLGKYFFYNKSKLNVTINYQGKNNNINKGTSTLTINGEAATRDTAKTLNITSKTITAEITDSKGYKYKKTYTLGSGSLLNGYTFCYFSPPSVNLIDIDRSEEIQYNGKTYCGLIVSYSKTDPYGLLNTATLTEVDTGSTLKFSSDNGQKVILYDSSFVLGTSSDSTTIENFNNKSYNTIKLTWKTKNSSLTSDVSIKTSSKEIAIFDFNTTDFKFNVPIKIVKTQCMGNEYLKCGIHMQNSDIIGMNGLFFNDTMTSEGGGAREGIFAPRSDEWSGAHTFLVPKDKNNWDNEETKEVTFYFYDRLAIRDGKITLNNVQIQPDWDGNTEDQLKRNSIKPPTSKDGLIKSYKAQKKNKEYNGTHYFGPSGNWLYGLPRSIPAMEHYFA